MFYRRSWRPSAPRRSPRGGAWRWTSRTRGRGCRCFDCASTRIVVALVLRQLSAAAQAAGAELEGALARLETVDAEHVCAFGSA